MKNWILVMITKKKPSSKMTALAKHLQTFYDYFEDIFIISISLSEVSRVIVGPPPFNVYTA